MTVRNGRHISRTATCHDLPSLPSAFHGRLFAGAYFGHKNSFIINAIETEDSIFINISRQNGSKKRWTRCVVSRFRIRFGKR